MKIAIVIPVYKSELTDNEKKSLLQMNSVLYKFDKYFIGPESLDFGNYYALSKGVKNRMFEKKYFGSIEGYSQLMLSPFFYKNFIEYDYILIYQLDAWVFDDQLESWCQRGYDYIGAPWIEKPTLTKGEPIFDLSPYFKDRVGNGGFSLRKVKSHYFNTLLFRPFLKYFIKNEDMFWGLFLYFLNPFFKRPSVHEALKFAFELNPRNSFKLTNHQLPFGVHAWEKYDPEFWKEWIK